MPREGRVVAEFARVNFGHASAESEASRAPELLLDGFVDPAASERRIFEDRRYLVLGRKGAGKTAVGLHLALQAQHRFDRFVRSVTASELVDQTPGSRAATSSPTAARWTLALHLMALLAEDQKQVAEDQDLRDMLNLLAAHGLLVPEKLPRHPRERTSRTVREPFLKAVEVTKTPIESDVRADVAGDQLLRRVVEVVTRAARHNWHLLVVDGFEEEAIERRDTRLGLARLVRAAASLNRLFITNGARVAVIVLCRVDIFDVLPMTDRNKLRQDAAVHLDWHSDEGLLPHTNLGRLVNRRSSLGVGREITSHTDFFGWRFRGRAVHRQLVRFTRSTPRDMIVLLTELRGTVVTTNRMDGRTLGKALKSYANSYLWHEIEDELETYLPEGAAVAALEILRRTGSSITPDAFIEHTPRELDPYQILRLLYDAGAIGQPRSADVVFRFADATYEPLLSRRFLVHPGLAYALGAA